MKNKPYTLFLRFEDFEKLWNWSQRHLPADIALFEGIALDPEFKGIGRAPANSVVVRPADTNDRPGGPLKAKLVPSTE